MTEQQTGVNAQKPPRSPLAVTPPARTRSIGIGRLLIAVYGILALAATGRSFVQILSRFNEAPLSYALSALAAVVYIVATVALTRQSAFWYRVAWATIGFEMVGVLVVGTLSLVYPVLFQHATVWSVFGGGYLFIPLVLPLLGMWWLSARRSVFTATKTPAAGRSAA